MITKKCNDAYKYGCELSVEVESEDQLKEFFYLKNTFTGPYYQNTCKTCVKKHHSDLFKSGEYNYRKKRQDPNKQCKTGAFSGDNSSE